MSAISKFTKAFEGSTAWVPWLRINVMGNEKSTKESDYKNDTKS